MATFSETFTISATLADGRTLSMKSTTTYTVAKVFDGTTALPLSGPTGSGIPKVDDDPVFMMIQYHGNGMGQVDMINTGTDAAAFSLKHDHSLGFHGPEVFDTDTSAVTATVTEELAELDFSNSALGGEMRVIILM